MPNSKLLIVSDGLVGDASADVSMGGRYLPHPALHDWQPQLKKRKTRWFVSTPKTAVEWYGELTGTAPAQLLSPLLSGDDVAGFTQFWIASPFHARLNRDRLHVMPDALFSWREADALWICDLLNPLLAEEGMKLVQHQSLLFLLCCTPLDASPVSFAAVSGHTLPNRHPEGVDGGALMRLTAEVQMMLSQHPAEHRKAAGESDVDGLWFWGGSPIHEETSANTLRVATRSPLLRLLADAQDAEAIITEAEHLHELMQANQPLPNRVVLAGSEHAVLMQKPLLTKWGQASWQPKSAKGESELMVQLRGVVHAA